MDWVKLGDVVEVQMGVSPSSSSYNEIGEGLPFYQGIADFGEIYPNERVYTTEAKRIANEGDILIGVRAPVGKVNINKKKSSIGRGLASLKSKVSNFNNKFVFLPIEENGILF